MRTLSFWCSIVLIAGCSTEPDSSPTVPPVDLGREASTDPGGDRLPERRIETH